MTRIEVRIVEDRQVRRRHCSACGRSTGDDGIYPVFADSDGNDHFLCLRCLNAGQRDVEAFQSRVDAHVARLEDYTRFVRALRNAEWTFPSENEWQAAVAEFDQPAGVIDLRVVPLRDATVHTPVHTTDTNNPRFAG